MALSPVDATASCAARDLAPEDATAGAPEWVHLLPVGEFRGVDGRAFRLADPDAVMAASLREGIDLVIDYEHQSAERPEAKSGPIPAAGWIKALQARADGLWGKVEWTARARELISARAYRYLSPVIRFSPHDRQVLRLCGAGLVHTPNLELTALSREEPAMPDTPAKPDPSVRLAAALGLDGGAADDAVQERFLALIERMTAFLAKAEAADPEADPAEYAPVAAMREALAERNAAIATMSERAASARVSEALAAGFITPAMRPWALALCREKPQSFDDFVAASAPAYAHFLRPAAPSAAPAGMPPSPGAAHASAEARAICRQLGIDPSALAR